MGGAENIKRYKMKERLDEKAEWERGAFFAISPTLIGGQLMGLFYRAQASIKRCQAVLLNVGCSPLHR